MPLGSLSNSLVPSAMDPHPPPTSAEFGVWGGSAEDCVAVLNGGWWQAPDVLHATLSPPFDERRPEGRGIGASMGKKN